MPPPPPPKDDAQQHSALSGPSRAERRLAAQFAAVKALAEAETWREGLSRGLGGMAAAMGWRAAGAWEPEESSGEIVCVDFWTADGRSSEFSRLSRTIRFPPGKGLPGRAWGAARPFWIPDVTVDPNFPRAAAAREQGIRMGIAVPVILAGKVEAVLEFFDAAAAEPDGELLEFFGALGLQLGEFLRRRRADAALKASAKSLVDLKTALDASAIVAVTDAAGRITSANERFVRISGYTREELLGKTHRIVNSGFHPPEFFKAMWEDLRAGRVWQGEVCNRAKDGRIYWVDTTITPFLGEDGKPFQYVAIRKDITDRMSLSLDHQAQVNAVDRSLAVVEFDLQGTVRSANENFLSVSGYSREELVGRPHSFLCYESEAGSAAYAEFWEALRRGEPRAGEPRRRGKGGREFWLEASYSPIIGLDGRPYKIIKYAADITARKAAEAAAARAASHLKSVLDNATQVSIIATDPAGAITVFNTGAENLLGYRAEEMLGKTPALIHVLEEVEERGRVLSLEYGRQIQGFDAREWTYVRKDGARFPVKLTVTALRGPSGDLEGFLGIAVDITQARLAREELARARDAALELAKAKAEFLANMSHEIRTPMNAVIGMTGLLLDTPLAPQQRDFAETIRNAGESLLALIGDILDFSKIEAGGMTLEVLDFDPRAVCEEVALLFAARAQDKGLEIAALVDEELPARLRGDSGRLRQILGNFVSNAVKFTERGEVVLRARRLAEEGGLVRVRFEVTDTGIGLDEAAKAKLFKAFSQADASTTRKYGGTGLGLAIAKRLAELMGGSVGLESAPGRGSVFWLELPLPRGAHSGALSAPELEGVRVLIVDDNATNRDILLRQTGSWRMRPSAAESGPAALAALRAAAPKDPYLLVLLDMQMPGMDGAAVAAEVAKDPALSASRLVLLSSMSSALPPEALARAGLHGALTKPVRKSSLFDCISEVLCEHPSCPLPARAPAPAAARPSWAGLRLLVAEDNAVNQKVALLQLQKLGCRADTAANGREAVTAVASIPYDLVLMDCQMPEMDGFEATRAIRQLDAKTGRRTVVVAMTANALEGDREKCLAAGMDDYVPKPVRLESLAAAIARWHRAFDPGALDGLRELGDPAALAEIVEGFLADAQAKLAALRAAAAGGDAAALERLAHGLKGAASTLGALDLQRIAGLLEQAGREGRTQGAKELVEALAGALGEAEKALRASSSLQI